MRKLAVVLAILVVATQFSTNLALSSPEDRVVALWHFDEVLTNGITPDTTGVNEGTLKPSYPSNCPKLVDGKIGNALQFDGVDDYVKVPDSDSLDVGSQFSIEAWVKPSALITGWGE